MNTRTKTRLVHFDHPFTLQGLDGIQSPGDYQVQDDEEQIPGISWLAYRRTATLIEIVSSAKSFSLVPIDHAELQSAIDRDHALSAAAAV